MKGKKLSRSGKLLSEVEDDEELRELRSVPTMASGGGTRTAIRNTVVPIQLTSK